MTKDEYIKRLEWTLLAAYEDLGYNYVEDWNCPGNTIGDTDIAKEFLEMMESNIQNHNNDTVQLSRFELFKKYVFQNHDGFKEGKQDYKELMQTINKADEFHLLVDPKAIRDLYELNRQKNGIIILPSGVDQNSNTNFTEELETDITLIVDWLKVEFGIVASREDAEDFWSYYSTHAYYSSWLSFSAPSKDQILYEAGGITLEEMAHKYFNQNS